MVVSQDFLKTPLAPQMPMGAKISRVKRNGTVSGVGIILPCSKAIPLKRNKYMYAVVFNFTISLLNYLPKSMCITSAVFSSINIFCK